MTLPYSWEFAALCVFQGVLVAAGRRRVWQIGRSRLVGVAVPVVAFAIGLLATRESGWTADAVAALATFGAPVAALAFAAAVGWRPGVGVALAPLAFMVAWRLDGLVADGAAVLLIGGACLTIAAVIAAGTSERAIVAGLVVLAAVDSYLVFRGHVAASTATLHAVEPPVAGGDPLPALQDASFGGALFGWLDLLAPALAGMLFAGESGRRTLAGVATAAAALLWGLLLSVSDQVPGTVPPLAALAVWFATRPPHARIVVDEIAIRPARRVDRQRDG